MLPSITVVIPTIGRRELSRAVQSALNQSKPPDEVVIAADSEEDLALPSDPRLRIIRVGPGAGGNAARQAGIEAARTDLIALLDDDDEWLPNHLELQLGRAAAMPTRAAWVLTSRVCLAVRGRRGDKELPAIPASLEDDLLDALFRKNRVRGGLGFMQASTLVFPRTLAIQHPFPSNLRFHQDIAWLTSLYRQRIALQVVQAAQVTVAHHRTPGSVSKSIRPEQSIEWGVKALGDRPRLLGDFVLTHSLHTALASGSYAKMLRTYLAGVRRGRPGTAAIIYGACLILKGGSVMACSRLLGVTSRTRKRHGSHP